MHFNEQGLCKQCSPVTCEAAEIKLRTLDLHHHLDFDLGSFGSDSRVRFDLPGFIKQRFAARMGQELNPQRAVVIGDTPNDILCARHGGFRVIALAHGEGNRQDLVNSHPDELLDSLDPETIVGAVSELTPHPSW
jgi:phosphoglycolate phosphatase